MKYRSESRHRNRHDIEWYSRSHHSPLYCLIFLHHSWSTRYTFKWGRPKRDSDPKTVLDLNFGLFLLLGLCLRLALLAFLRICLNKIECPIYQISWVSQYQFQLKTALGWIFWDLENSSNGCRGLFSSTRWICQHTVAHSGCCLSRSTILHGWNYQPCTQKLFVKSIQCQLSDMFLASDGICSPSRQLSYPGPSSRSRPPHRPAQLTAAISPGKTERIKCDECLLHFQLAEEQRGGFHLSSRMQNHKPPPSLCKRLMVCIPADSHPTYANPPPVFR